MKLKKLILPAVLLILGFCGLWLYFRLSPYPEFEELLVQQYSCRIYDRDGKLLQVTSLEEGLRREFTPLNEIPETVQKIFIKAEDQHFYFHHGVDWAAAVNAFFQNYSSKKTVRGASTITMQLAKICAPVTDHNFKRKIEDVINAFRIEARLNKKQILELYLNSVPFGMNVCGVTSAARSFYGKNLQDLSPEEICCLAVIPRRPASYNPAQYPKQSAELAKLLANKLSYVDSDKILEAAKKAQFYKYPYLFPHYLLYLRKNSPELFTSYEAKLSVSLDIQQKAETYLLEALEYAQGSRISNGALLVLDNSTGEVISWIGNGNWFDTSSSGQIDGVLVKNQPGSSMKPFLYALAFDTADKNNHPLYYPSKIIADVPTEFGNETLYIPANFNNQFNGPIRTRIALASSLNIPAVTILNDLGVEAYLKKLYQLGFNSLYNGGKEADLGLALGAGEITLQELTTAFSVFPRDGKDFSNNQIYSQDTARLICSILSDKGARALGFGYSQTFETDYPSIFKTGTSNQYQNITALGATKHFTIGVWMGNFAGQTVIGKTGSSLPAWIAKNVLDYLEQSTEAEDFLPPENWSHQKICSLSGLAATKDCPATIYEYVRNDMELPACNWHKKTNDDEVEIIYPGEYQQWLRKNKIKASINYNSTPLTLISPKNDSLFYASSVKAVNQAITVELIGGEKHTLTYKYDNKASKKVSRPFKFQLPVEKGNHKCQCICGEEEITFTYVVK